MTYSPELYISPFTFPIIPYLFTSVKKLEAKPCGGNSNKKKGCPVESQAQRKATYKAKRFSQYKEAIKHFPNDRASSLQIANLLGFNTTSIASTLKDIAKEFPKNFYKCGEVKHQMNGRNTNIWAFKEEHEEEVMNDPYVTINMAMKGKDHD